MDNNLETKTKSCGFKTSRKQCLVKKEEKGSETIDQNFPCNYGGDPEDCKLRNDYLASQKE